jgi:hypothetical protein
VSAYRHGSAPALGRVHDYTRKQGIEETFILTPKDAPDWASDRSRLWNEVEASETRRNLRHRPRMGAGPSVRDQRNHHAHVLTSTRKLAAGGFTAKTRVLDSAKTGGVEIEQMRGLWAELQNRALERVGEVERVDHRSLEKQRETALDRGDKLSAEELDRDPELKLEPATNSMERRAKLMAER